MDDEEHGAVRRAGGAGSGPEHAGEPVPGHGPRARAGCEAGAGQHRCDVCAFFHGHRSGFGTRSAQGVFCISGKQFLLEWTWLSTKSAKARIESYLYKSLISI